MQIHGGDIYNNKVELDFSANINPCGMPASVKNAAIDGVFLSTNYPEVGCNRLKEAIAEKEGVAKEWISCGNGAAEVIFQLVFALRPKKAFLVWPTFAEYGQALMAVNCETESFLLKEEDKFQVTEQVLEQIHPELDIMFLCNPNNPTGGVVAPELMVAIAKRCQECKVTLVVDECFQDFLQDEDAFSMIGSLKEYENVLVLKAFTKMYAMPGLRLGYAVTSNQALLAKMQTMCQPWNVSIPAQLAGMAAVKEEAFARTSRDQIQQARSIFEKQLSSLGLKIYGSKANYIFFRGPAGLYGRCLEQGILIRSCSNYQGLNEHFYRVAVKSQENNEQLIEVLKKVL